MNVTNQTTLIISQLSVLLFLMMGVPLSSAIAGGYPFNPLHEHPYDFQFGDNIDTHQQSRLKKNDEISGFLYITFTGNFIEGIPVAEHCDETTPTDSCEVGWIIRGKPGIATFVFHENDHPIWLVSSRNVIPQPGSFSHFHWLDGPNKAGGLVEGDTFVGYFLELQAVDTFFLENGGDMLLVEPGIVIRTHVNIVGSFP